MIGPELTILANALLVILILTTLVASFSSGRLNTKENVAYDEPRLPDIVTDYSEQPYTDAAISPPDNTDFAFFLKAGEDMLIRSNLIDPADAIIPLEGLLDPNTLFLAGADADAGPSDLFVVHDRENLDNVVEITDFVKGQDVIELRFDDGDTPPKFAISIDESSNDATIMLDGVRVLKVTSAATLSAEDITLVAA